MTPLLALSQTAINFTYLVAAVLLIVGIRRLSSPPTARSGNWIAAVGMGIAIFFTFLDRGHHELLADRRRNGRSAR